MDETRQLIEAIEKLNNQGAGWPELLVIAGFAYFIASKFLTKLGLIEKAITDLGERIMKVEMTHNGRMNVQDAMIAEIKEDQREIKDTINKLNQEFNKQKGV